MRVFEAIKILSLTLALALWFHLSLAEASTPYKVPVPGDQPINVTQSHGGLTSHRAGTGAEFAVDFANHGRPFQVVAARGGTILALSLDSDVRRCKGLNVGPNGEAFPGCWTKANYVLVDHGDGRTAGLYLHLERNSISLKVGDNIQQGQPIGIAGDTGFSDAIHLHFQVEALPTDQDRSLRPNTWWWTKTIDMTFEYADPRGRHVEGVPPVGSDYRSLQDLPFSISGRAYLDSNGNGAQDTDEQGIAGLAISLPGVTEGTTRTNSSGSYSFVLAQPGSYEVKIDAPEGQALTTSNPVVRTVSPNARRATANFGLRPRGPSARVWSEKDSYAIGESGAICYEVSQSGRIVITDTDPTGKADQFYSGPSSGLSGCKFVPRYYPPVGTDTLRIELYEDQRLIASGESTYRITNTEAPPVTPAPQPTRVVATASPIPTSKVTASPTATPAQYSMSASTDSSRYEQGESIWFCYHLSPEGLPYRARLLQSGSLLREWNDNGAGGGDCFFIPVSSEAQLGSKQLLVEAYVGGQRVAQATVSFSVISSTPPTSVPPTATSSSGWLLCDGVNYGPPCVNINGNTPNLAVLNFDNRTSSIVAPSGGNVCLIAYTEPNYISPPGSLKLYPGQSQPNFQYLGFMEGSISSVQLSTC